MEKVKNIKWPKAISFNSHQEIVPILSTNKANQPVIVRVLRDKEVKCKSCNKTARRIGSAYCQDFRDNYVNAE